MDAGRLAMHTLLVSAALVQGLARTNSITYPWVSQVVYLLVYFI